MPQYLPLPDGSSVTIREGETPQQAYARAQKMYPEAFGQKAQEGTPESGFLAAGKAGLAGLKSDIAALAGKTGLMSPEEAEKYIAEQKKYQERTFKPTQTWGEAPLTKGLELLGGSLPYMAAPVVAGLGALALPEAAAAAPVVGGLLTAGEALGLGLTGLTSAAQFTGSNISRQMEEGKSLREASLGSALAAAPFQAALDVLSLKMIPGVRGIFSAAGKEVTQKGAEEFAKQSLLKVAADYTAATGKAMGTEGLTEAAQQVLERMQAGLNLTDPEARDEYWQNFVGGAVLGGALAPAGRFMERRGEAKKAQADAIAEAQKEAEAARAAEEAKKAAPDYAINFVQDYEARKQQFTDARGALKKPGKDATPDVWQAYKDQKKEVDALRESLDKDAKEYNRLKPQVAAEQAKAAEEARRAKLTPFEYMFGEISEPSAPKKEDQAELQYWEREPAAPAAQKSAADYAAERVALAKDQMPDPTVADYAQYIMQDPAQAAELVRTQPRILGLNRKDNQTLLLGLDLQLKALEQRRAAGEADVYAQRGADITAQLPQTPTPNPLEKYFAGLEDQMNLPRSHVEPTFEYLDPLFEKALSGPEPVVKLPQGLQPTPQAKLIREKMDAMFNQLASLEEEAAAARRGGRMDYATELAYRANRTREQLDAIAGGTPAGGLTEGLKGATPQESTAGVGYGQRLAQLRETQDSAINELQTAVDQLAKNEAIGKEQLNLLKEAPAAGKGEAKATQGVLADRAANARAKFISAVLEEIATHRRAEGRGTIGQDEALRVASQLYDQINELINRVQATPRRENLEEVTLLPAQMRAGKVQRGAVTGMADTRPLEQRPFGAYQAAVDNILDNLRAIRDQAINYRPQARRVEADLLRKQFPTTEAERVAQEKGERVGQETKDTGVVLLDSDALNNIREALKNPNLSEGARTALQKAYDAEVKRLEENRAGPLLTQELRRHAEYSQNQLEKALQNPDLTDDVRAPLEQALDRIRDGKVSRDLLDAVDNITQKILTRGVYGAEQKIRPALPGRVVRIGKTKRWSPMSDPYRRGREQTTVYTGGLDQDIAELQDIMRASEPTAREQIEAGQKQLDLLFQEPGKPARRIETDLGYIRMTPQAFANSPRMKPIWEALAKARARATSQAAKKAVKDRRVKAALETIERLNAKMENIKADTKFFQKDMSKWSDDELARIFVGPRGDLTTDEYKQKLNEAKALLAAGQRLDDIDNQMLQYMQDSNKEVKDAVQALDKELEVYRSALKRVQAMLNKAPLSKEQRAVLTQMEKVRTQNNRYRDAVTQAVARAKNAMSQALGELLDPNISQLQEQLNKAKAALAKEEAELDKTNINLLNVLSQEEGANRMQLATYELFKYEEKQGIIDDLRQQIETAQTELFEFQSEKSLEFDGAYAAAQAMLDDRVTQEREKLGRLEQQLADMRGDTVGKNPKNYPFAYQMLEAQERQQRKILEDAQKAAAALEREAKAQQKEIYQELLAEEKQSVKADKEAAREKLANAQARLEQVEKSLGKKRLSEVDRNELQKERFELNRTIAQQQGIIRGKPAETGKQVVRDYETGTYTVNKTLTEGQKKYRERAAAARQAEIDAAAKAKREAEASEKERAIDEQLDNLYEEFAGLPGSTSANKLADIMADPESSAADREAATLKLGVLQNIRSLEEQLKVMKEPKPSRKPRAATAPSTAALSKAKPFRTGAIRGETAEAPEAFGLEDVYQPAFGGGRTTPTFESPKYTEPGVATEGAELPVSGAIEARDRRLERVYNVKADYTSPYHGKTYAEAAALAAKNAKNPLYRKLFSVIAESIAARPSTDMHGRVFITSKAGFNKEMALDRITGFYDPHMNLVIAPSPSLSADAEEILLHELAHVATFDGLRNIAFGRQIDSLREQVNNWLNTVEGRTYYEANKDAISRGTVPGFAAYGLTSNEEFLAEVFSNRSFQDMLKQIPSEKVEKKTGTQLFPNLWKRLVNVFSEFFDLRTGAERSLLEDALEVADRAMIKTEEYVEAQKRIALNKDKRFKAVPIAVRAPRYATKDMEEAGKGLDRFVANQRGLISKFRANATGLAFETQVVDRFAGFERLAKYLPEHLGTQMMYYLRMYDQRMNFVSQAVAHGAPRIVEKTRPDGKVERIIEAKDGPSIKNTVTILKEANPMVGNAEAVNRLFTGYMAAIRADNKGFESLNFGEGVTRADLDNALSVVNNNPQLKAIFDRARGEYNAYNRNLIDFLVETGALSRKVADRLMAENDYIPFYREQNGVAQLIIGSEAPIRIGSIKEQPYLQELVGGDQPILDFLTSSVQNTNLLVDMGMRNLATKNAVFELINLNAAKLVKGTPSGKDVVKFKIDGDDKYAVLSTEKVRIGNKEFETGVPADILVKGMEGIPTQMPFLFRAMAMPAQLLRKGVTLSPLYMARQLFRDSLAAPIMSGADFVPVLGALRQIGSPTKATLERRGITGGQQFKGTSEDLSKILRDVADGKPGWMSLLGKAEAMAMEADALTRRAQYNSYINQGMSEMEATLMALESMNFSKRGASPSIHIANALIPFFNAQIQGLNVLYKAMFGKMPFNDKLKIRQKLLQRGGLMAASAIAYAMFMQDDEAYKNANPDEKYTNWFLRFPGMDEPLRVPVPFEIGYIFKSLPEAMVNSMLNEHGGEEAVKAFKTILLQTLPGGTSYGIPQALKPAIEVGLGKSFYTGRDILSAREKELLPEEQFRANTTEAAKAFGKLTGTSPIMLEQLVKGYTGTMGLAFLQALSVGVPDNETPEGAVKRLSEYPIIGGAFQPNDAGGITNSVYERMNEAQKVERTYTKMIEEGRLQEANALLQRRGDQFMQSELAKEFKNNMNELTQAERAIQATKMPPDEKRKQLDEIRRLKIAISKTIRDVADKTVGFSSSL